MNGLQVVRKTMPDGTRYLALVDARNPRAEFAATMDTTRAGRAWLRRELARLNAGILRPNAGARS